MCSNNPAGIDFRQFKPNLVSFRHSESKKLQKSFRRKTHYANQLRPPKGEAVEWIFVAKGTLILTRPEAPPNPVDVVIYFSDTGDGGQLYIIPQTGQVGEVFAELPKGVSK